jgi:maltooligosyltrehalose trehalohydrolase
MSYQYPSVGAFYDRNLNKCLFTVWAPARKHAEILLDADPAKVHPLKQDERGYWSISLDGIKPGTHYLYRLDHEKTLPDPASRWQPNSVHGPSAVIDPHFEWTDVEWKGLALGDMIQYELHVGTFTSEGTFEGIISKLDYLKELGVNTIELMPVAQFPGTRNWGYDGVYPFAVQDSYGGVAGLKLLVNEAHKRGLAVILDVVYNHVGPEGNYLPEYGPYFTGKYKTGWGQAINYDDAYCDGVRHYFWQNALMWLDEFHIDGLRLDAVHAIWDSSARHFIQCLREKVSALEVEKGRKKVLIAEFDLNNPRYIDPPERGGYGLSGQWVDEFHHALHALVTGEKDGYYSDFGDIAHLEKAFRDTYVYTGQYSAHRKKHFGVMPAANSYHQFIVFAQNHDHTGNRMMGDRLTEQLSLEQQKLTAAAYLLSPYVPMIFMGEEYSETNPFQYFVSHTDPALVEAVRKGRKEEFAYFKWAGEVPDPQSEEAFNKSRLSWEFETDPNRAVMLKFYKHLISFRKQRIAMQGKERNSMHVFPATAQSVLAIERRYGDDYILIIFNFNPEPASFHPPVRSALRKFFDSADEQWRGPGAITQASVKKDMPVVLHGHSVVMFEY